MFFSRYGRRRKGKNSKLVSSSSLKKMMILRLSLGFGIKITFSPSITQCVLEEVQAQHMCKSTRQTFKGLCFTDSSCRKACLTEEFTGGHCSKLQRKCLGTKICVFEKKFK
ncbi:hypothetical protein AABB24_038458 [Solanum stoloniferum]|uniref:Knottins-like domain-containing protein n=1 Tax=Solanum stoloniferum TaxID=62892 RepID=A0ABD2QXJ3_9SOLN